MSESGEGFIPNQDVFREHFSQGVIKSITFDQIPPNSRKRLKEYVRGVPPDKDPELESTGVIELEDGKIFFAYQLQEDFKYIYLIDSDQKDEILGWGDVIYAYQEENRILKDKPVVGYTRTFPNYQKQGLGRRRLLIMNALSQSIFNLPLYSNPVISEEARSLWESLVAEGRAREFEEAGKRRFAFN